MRAGLDARVGDRVVEGPVVGPVHPTGRGQKGGTCLRQTETAKGFGCGAGHRRRVVDDDTPERLEGRGIAMEACHMAGRLADIGVAIAEAGANGPAGFIAVDPGQCPESLLADGGGRRSSEYAIHSRHRGGPDPGEGVGGPGDDGGARVGQQRREAGGLYPLPIESETARIGDRHRAIAPHPIDRAEGRRLLKLRRRATQLVPAAGIDNEERAVGILDHVGGMEVDPVGLEEGIRFGGERGAGRHEFGPEHRPQVERRREQVAGPRLAVADAGMAVEAARSSGAEMRKCRQQSAGAGMAIEDAMVFPVDATVKGVDQPVALTAARVDKERARHDPLPFRREHDVDGVVHAAGQHRLEFTRIVAGAEDVAGAGRPAGTAGEIVALLGKGPLAPVDPAIAAEVGAVEIVGTAGERLGVKPHLARFGNAVVVGISELPDLRRRGDIERAAIPQRPFRHHQPLGIDRAAVERAVAVAVYQAEDTMGGVLHLFSDGDVRAARLGDVEPATLVEVDRDGAFDERRARGDLDGESVGQGDRAGVKAELGGMAGGDGRQHRGDNQQAPAKRHHGSESPGWPQRTRHQGFAGKSKSPVRSRHTQWMWLAGFPSASGWTLQNSITNDGPSTR